MLSRRLGGKPADTHTSYPKYQEVKKRRRELLSIFCVPHFFCMCGKKAQGVAEARENKARNTLSRAHMHAKGFLLDRLEN